jgi:hypothetical protein
MVLASYKHKITFSSHRLFGLLDTGQKEIQQADGRKLDALDSVIWLM